MSLNLFIIGPSGSGKSTQAELIAKKYKLTHLSMGQLLRDEIKSGSRLGLDIKKNVDQGTPVPNDIVLPILSVNLNQINNQNFIIDGFPRLVDQGHYIDLYLKDKGNPSTLLIHLVVDFAEISRRRQNKGEQFQSQDRTDNTSEAIANRQKVLYEANVNPVLDYYRHQNKLFEVDGNRPVEPIFDDICQYINKILKINQI